MTDFDSVLSQLKASLCAQVDADALRASNPIVHKWKATWRTLLLRESVAWRLHDLLAQSHRLAQDQQILGARILLRSAFETLAMLIYVNRSMRNVVAGKTDFHVFSEQTTRLVIGSRDNSTTHESVGVLTTLQAADKRYPGMHSWYEALCETAHPNYEGLLLAYSSSDPESKITAFENRWHAMYGSSHAAALMACFVVFEGEYNHEWLDAFRALEHWMEANDEKLEASRPGAR